MNSPGYVISHSRELLTLQKQGELGFMLSFRMRVQTKGGN